MQSLSNKYAKEKSFLFETSLSVAAHDNRMKKFNKPIFCQSAVLCPHVTIKHIYNVF